MKKVIMIRLWVKLAVVLGGLLSVAGCESDANVEVPQSQPRLVLSCFLSPQDTMLTVTVSKSVPIYGNADTGNPNRTVNDATVTLSDGNISVVLNLTQPNTGIYATRASNLPILAGRTYFLNVTAPGGFQAEAFCTIPARRNEAITQIRLDSTIRNTDFRYTEYSLSVEWQDAPGEGDYYRLFAERPGSVQRGFDPSNPGKTDTLYYSIGFDQGEVFTRDAGQDGRKFIVRNGLFTSLYDPSGSGEPDRMERKINVVLMTTDRGYYEFHRALANYVGDNPFSEPTLLYSNVQGGLGIMAGYQRFTTIFRY
jgi:hypothetical protein